MKLIVGGAFQGKRRAAEELFGMKPSDFLDGASCSMEEIFTCRGLYHFHEFIRRLLLDGQEERVDSLAEELTVRNPDLMVVSTELGYGIVPIDPFDRLYREKVGRVCCQIAANSDEVYRVIAGLPSRIKGGQP